MMGKENPRRRGCVLLPQFCHAEGWSPDPAGRCQKPKGFLMLPSFTGEDGICPHAGRWEGTDVTWRCQSRRRLQEKVVRREIFLALLCSGAEPKPSCCASCGSPEKTFIVNTELCVADYINYFSGHDFDPNAASLDQ